MMTIDELKERKKEFGYTNEMIVQLSGVPLGTVQKVFAGVTKNPRFETLAALSRALSLPHKEPIYYGLHDYHLDDPYEVHEEEYIYGSSVCKIEDETRGEYTIEDYYNLPDDMRAELIDGELYLMATPTIFHQVLVSLVGTEFMNYKLSNGKDCWPIIAPLDVRLNKDNSTMVEPDLLVICKEDEDLEDKNSLPADSHLYKHRDNFFNGVPRFVMEVISPSSRRKDTVIKLNKYMTAGVKEYWIVDPDREQVLVYDFDSENFPATYSFDDVIPVAISGGELTIDFGELMGYLC